jgi:hypothetical protein
MLEEMSDAPHEDHFVALSDTSISLEATVDSVRHSSYGAVTSFIGTTRDNFEGKCLSTVSRCSILCDLTGSQAKRLCLSSTRLIRTWLFLRCGVCAIRFENE